MPGESARESPPLEAFTNRLKHNLYSFFSNFLSVFILLIKIFVNIFIDIIKSNVDLLMELSPS
jgi:hypothetical protein